MGKMQKKIQIEFNGFIYELDVMDVANHRAEAYKDEFDGDHQRSLDEDTLTLFEESPYEIYDWARNNMNAEDAPSFELVQSTAPTGQEVWDDGEWELSDEG